MNFTPMQTSHDDDEIPSSNYGGDQPPSLVEDDGTDLDDIIRGMFLTEQNYTRCFNKNPKFKSSSSGERGDLSASPVSVTQSFCCLHDDRDLVEDNARYEVCKWIYKVRYQHS